MKKALLSALLSLFVVLSINILPATVHAATGDICGPDGTVISGPRQGQACITVDQGDKGLNFRIPNFSDILTFAIRAVFVFGGIAALFFLLLGAFSWIVSGGEKDKVGAAQSKIQAAVIGVILIAVVLAIVVTLEQVIFAGKICLGISCALTIPSLIK